MSDLDDFKATYFDECSELLGELEEQFTAIEEGERDSDRLNAVFRAIHSIKGGAGAFGFSSLVGFAHEFETLLDYVRNSKVELTDDVVTLCIRANDIVADFVSAARTGEALAADYGAEEKARFITLCKGDSADDDEGGEPMEEFDIEFTPVTVDLEVKQEPVAAGVDSWLVRFKPHSELYSRANDPLLLLRELGELGEVTVTARVDELPNLVEFDPFGVYCLWDVTIKSETVTEDKIREVFEFVEGDCDIEITKGVPAQEEPEEINFDDGPSFADLAADIKPEKVAAPQAKLAPKTVALAPGAGDHAEHDNNDTSTSRPVGVQSIRVDLDKVDRVVNMVSELVITQSMLTQQMDENLRQKYQELVRGLEILAQTTRGLQDSVMAIRAQPVKSVFSRMPRLVRELAGKTDKKIKLETVGENTEIDKTVIEQLSDPLTHMIRNSADHGIEKPEKRIAMGKPETGTIRLSAEQSGGNILIIVEDDGAGINRERVVEIARLRGVIGEDQQLTEEQIDNLIFAPGILDRDRSLRHFRTRRRHGCGAVQHQEDRRLGACALVDRQRHAHDAAFASDAGRARRHAGGGRRVPLCHPAVLDRGNDADRPRRFRPHADRQPGPAGQRRVRAGHRPCSALRPAQRHAREPAFRCPVRGRGQPEGCAHRR